VLCNTAECSLNKLTMHT